MTATATTTPRLRIGVVGAGHFGRYHALKAAASARATLVGIHDRDTERAKTVGWEAGAPEMSWDALLAVAEVTHHEQGIGLQQLQ